MAKESDGFKLIGENRKAYFNYEALEKLECGIELQGTEVKSLREGRINFVDSFCEIKNNQLFIQKLHIAPYSFGNIFNHAAERPRRLLAHKQEIAKWARRIREKGLTIVPLRFYFKNRRVKVEVALCRGKKLYDKRESIKERDLQRASDRERANY